MSNAGAWWMQQVRQLPCIPCLMLFDETHSCQEVHHPDTRRNELSQFRIIPMCIAMHQGQNGIHGLHRRGFERTYKLTEDDMLAKVNELVARKLMR